MNSILTKRGLLFILLSITPILQFGQSRNEIVKQAQKQLLEKYIFLDKAKETKK